MKSTFVLSALLATLSYTQANVHEMPLLMETYQDSDAYYYIQGLRGFWIGYEQGFYKNPKNDLAN